MAHGADPAVQVQKAKGKTRGPVSPIAPMALDIGEFWWRGYHHERLFAVEQDGAAVRRHGAMTVWDFTNWIRVHWFELATLTLLSLNLWFAFEVLSVLRAAIQTMISLANWLDRTRDESTGQSLPAETQGGGRWTPALVGTAPPLLITIALAALSWALLVALLVGIAGAVWAIF